MREQEPPIVVLGAGVDELVATHYLARAGRRVVVLDNHGAGDDTEPRWIPPRIVRDLALDRHGLESRHSDPWITAPLPAGGCLELWQDVGRSADAIRRVSPGDAEKWPEFCERMARLARLLETVYAAPPPDPMSRELGELARLAGLGLRARRLGRQGLEDLLRLLPMPVADLLDDWFENDALKAALGAAGVMHVQQGPRSGGTAFRLLHHHVGSPPGVFRPPRSNVARVLAELPGADRRSAQVRRIIVRDGRAVGVALANGEEIAASAVVSGIDARRTLLELVDPAWLDPELVRAVRSIRSRGVVARITLTLDRAPGFTTLVLAPSLDELERAYDDAKYGRVSRRPYLEARNAEPSVDGRHRVEVQAQYAPYALDHGEWDDARRRALGNRVVEMLSPHLPSVVERAVLAPPDLEKAHGWPQGQAHHAELALDQLLWMRPIPQLARYATPIEGLYLCGPGMHPGAGIAGAAGANAARVLGR